MSAARRILVTAAFDDSGTLIRAIRVMREKGFAILDAYSPHEAQEIAEAMELPESRIGWIVLIAGLLGFASTLLLQEYGAAVSYPLNIGGRPLNSIPAFICTSFEMGVLWAVAGAVFGMLIINRLPALDDPIFQTPGFGRATSDSYFLAIAVASRGEADAARAALAAIRPRSIAEVAA